MTLCADLRTEIQYPYRSMHSVDMPTSDNKTKQTITRNNKNQQKTQTVLKENPANTAHLKAN